MSRSPSFLHGQQGSAAVEFALVIPVLLFLILGVINLSMIVYAGTNLHSAVEQAARYATTQTNLTGSDPGSTAISGYASGHYLGPGIGATFSYALTGACNATTTGHQVTGTGSYKLAYGFGAINVPLSATACFP